MGCIGKVGPFVKNFRGHLKTWKNYRIDHRDNEQSNNGYNKFS
jgi:hypothetical protein